MGTFHTQQRAWLGLFPPHCQQGWGWGKGNRSLEEAGPDPVCWASMGLSGSKHVTLHSFSIRWGIPEILLGSDTSLFCSLVFTFQSLPSECSNHKKNPPMGYSELKQGLGVQARERKGAAPAPDFGNTVGALSLAAH